MEDKLILSFVSEKEGEFDVMAALTCAPDYGKFLININDLKTSSIIDVYSDKVEVKAIRLGRFSIKKGKNIVEFIVTAARNNDKKTAFMGLDYLEIN